RRPGACAGWPRRGSPRWGGWTRTPGTAARSPAPYRPRAACARRARCPWPRDADRRRATDHHVLDGARHLPVVAVDAVDLTRGEHALVEHDHAAASPLDRTNGHGERRPLRGAYPNRL